MGIIKALSSAVSTGLADQWLEIIEPDNLNNEVLFTTGKLIRNRGKSSNTKRTEDVISNGTIIHVPENTCMLLVDGGKIVSMSAEAGYFKVDNSESPSIFNGDLAESVKETFNRFKFGGQTPYKQKVYYINLQEVRNIKFGTSAPLMYFDSNYNLDLEIRTHGHYSVKILDPILFYKEVSSKSGESYTIKNFDSQYQSEFMSALQTSISNLSIDGVRISHLPSKSYELSQTMSNVLDESWRSTRGFEVLNVGINAIIYTDDSKEILKERNKGAALSDSNIRQGYVQGSIARGFENAGKNESGSSNAFIGMGFGMNSANGLFGEFTKSNNEQIKTQNQQYSNPTSGSNYTKQSQQWNCKNCSNTNIGKFCSECGEKKPERSSQSFCTNCGFRFEGNIPNFCSNCGQAVENR